MIYITADTDDGQTIKENATIEAFASLDEAREYYADLYENSTTPQFKTGQFGDAWLKLRRKPDPADKVLFYPFAVSDLNVRKPDTGHGYWVTPQPDILICVEQ